ncbi:MAG: dienelactone hydrolase family protein [Solirubrobacterales bacterium]
MAGEMVEFVSNGGTAEGYLATPADPNGRALVVIQEWWGLMDEIKAIADRYAAAGYYALVPDHFHGDSTESPDEAEHQMMAMNIADVEKELIGAVDFVASKAGTEIVGATGYCIGGALCLYAASLNPKVAASSSFYYVFPHGRPEWSRIEGPVLMHFGTEDAFMSTEDIEELTSEMTAAGVDLVVEFYEGAGHAFCNTANRLGTYNEEYAELAFARNLEFFDKNLG